MSCLELQAQLDDLAAKVAADSSSTSFAKIESLAQSIADILRVQSDEEDNHTTLGRTTLPRTLTDLLASTLPPSSIPTLELAPVVLQILRVGANLCLNHDENRGHLLDASFPQAVVRLLEAYAACVQPGALLDLQLIHLQVVRTAIGVLLNTSLAFDPIKVQLNRQAAGLTILKLGAGAYPPGFWLTTDVDDSSEEWATRQGLLNWVWRLISELREVNEETVHIFGAEALPFIVPYLKTYTPPFELPPDPSRSSYATFIQTDLDLLSEVSTLIESLGLDVEDVRLSLGKGLALPAEHRGIPCLSILLNFIQYGNYHPLWAKDDTRRQKVLDTCKAAIIKVIVEVAAEEGNEAVLWDNSNPAQPGGLFVGKMVDWLRSFVAQSASNGDTGFHRDDLAICASLSLGNLSRREQHAAAFVSEPYCLTELLASNALLSKGIDIRLKHGVLGLLRHLAQAATHSQVVQQSLTAANLVTRIRECGIWDQKTDAMAEVVQVSAIAVVKFLCNANVENTFATVLPPEDDGVSALKQILSLVARSESLHIKSEGTRVLVNVIRSLWSNEDSPSSPVVSPITTSSNQDSLFEKGKKRQDCFKLVTTSECANALTNLLSRSGRFPGLVNEAVVALSLLASQRSGAPLILKAISASPVHDIATAAVPSVQPSASSSTSSEASSPVVPTPGQNRIQLPSQPADMLVAILEDTGSPARYPIEVRLNVCSLLVQVGKNTRDVMETPAVAENVARLRDAMRPILERLSTSPGEGKEALLAASAKKALQLLS